MAKNSELKTRYETWKQDPSDATMGQLLTAAEPVIKNSLRSYAGGSDDPIYRLEALRLSAAAFNSYDPDRGAQLETYLMSSLQPLKRTVYERSQGLHLPQKAWYDLRNLRRSRANFETELGRDPTQLELSDATGLSIHRIDYLEKFERSEIPESVLREKNPDEYFQPGETTMAESEFWAEAVYYSLDPLDQTVYDYRVGAHGKPALSNQKIAQKLGLSEGAVSQRVTRIVQLMGEG